MEVVVVKKKKNSKIVQHTDEKINNEIIIQMRLNNAIEQLKDLFKDRKLKKK